MEIDRDILAIQRKLAHCRQLAKDFPDGPTAKHIGALEDELRAELSAELPGAPIRNPLTTVGHTRVWNSSPIPRDRRVSGVNGSWPSSSNLPKDAAQRRKPLKPCDGASARYGGKPESWGSYSTRHRLTRWNFRTAAALVLMPKEIAIALWSLAAACVVAFSVAALVSPH